MNAQKLSGQLVAVKTERFGSQDALAVAGVEHGVVSLPFDKDNVGKSNPMLPCQKRQLRQGVSGRVG